MRTLAGRRKKRSVGGRGLMLWAFVVSVLVQGLAFFALHRYQESQPRSFELSILGPGEVLVYSTPAAIICHSPREEGDTCEGSFRKGVIVRLFVNLKDNALMEAWSPNCKIGEGEAACEVEIKRNTYVKAFTRLPPTEVDIAFIELPPEKDESVTLPKRKTEKKKVLSPALLAKKKAAKKKKKKEKKKVAKKERRKMVLPKNMKSVEVPDENEVKKAPDDAQFLSDKNRDVIRETVAKHTNLERQQLGQRARSERSDSQDKDVGAKEDKIAQLEDADSSSLEKKRERETPKTGKKKRAQGDLAGKQGQNGKLGDGKNKRAPTILAMRGIHGRGAIGKVVIPAEGGRKRGRKGRKGITVRLSQRDYERIVGREYAKAERRVSRRRVSKRRGRFQRRMTAIRSSLENFTSEVRPGNQVALKTRAAPFAVYIARMHRSIHELWGFGFLEDLNDKRASHPLNNWNLATVIEVAINPNGTIYKTTITRTSGLSTFDIAALDVIYSAGPYREPPQMLRSVDGRVYMHWSFKRNYEQCGTMNVQPFILTKVRGTKGNDLLSGDPRKGMRRKKKGALSVQVVVNRREIIHTANLWLSLFAARSAVKLAELSAFPFVANGLEVGNSTAEVAQFYRHLFSETRGPIYEWKIMSPGEYRKNFIDLPRGYTSAQGNSFMVVNVGRKNVALVLKRLPEGTYAISAMYL